MIPVLTHFWAVWGSSLFAFLFSVWTLNYCEENSNLSRLEWTFHEVIIINCWSIYIMFMNLWSNVCMFVLILHFASLFFCGRRKKKKNFSKKEDSNQLTAFRKIPWGHQLKILSFFPIAAPNDWVLDASPDVISSNASCTDLNQTLGLACCCHTDRFGFMC